MTYPFLMHPPEASGILPYLVIPLIGLMMTFWTGWRFSLRRAFQVFSLVLFATLFSLAAYGGRPAWPVDLFLFSDPLLAGVTWLAARTGVALLWVSLVFVLLAVVMGRVFCSHVCPLGALLDLSDRWLVRKNPNRKRDAENHETHRRLRRTKYALLLIIVGAAAVGLNLAGLFDPLVMFTRFSAAVLFPFLLLLGETGLTVLQPLADALDSAGLRYLELLLPSFEGALGLLFLMVLILVLSRIQSRFWCRHLCPLGALLGWLGRWPLYRRRVSEACNACDRCTRDCPTGAIHKDGKLYDSQECIVCLQCVRVCPQSAVAFGFKTAGDQLRPGPDLSRRALLSSAIGGMGVGLGMRLDASHASSQQVPQPVRHDGLIRPPGALPEPEFISRCVRCGECLRACLTNTLQPDWFRSGLEGIWSPHLNLRHAHCEASCNVCGQVCPTGAIRPLSLPEKQHAKMGTAVIRKQTCVAWVENRRCLICDEACPYNAIRMIRVPERTVPVPVVEPKRCIGCGTCEEKCPVIGMADIVVRPHGEMRLEQGSYTELARRLGMRFELRKQKDPLKDQSLFDPAPESPRSVPGSEAPSGELPPLPPGISGS